MRVIRLIAISSRASTVPRRERAPSAGLRELDWCDAHHVIPWPAGPTMLHDLILRCRTHHRYVHYGVHRGSGWIVTLEDDGWARWTGPGGTTRWGQRHGSQPAEP